MTTVTPKSTIAKRARQSVREAVRAEMMNLRAATLPLVSDSEQSEIVQRHKKPTRQSVRSVRGHF